MGGAGLSASRLDRLSEVMTGYVERGVVPGAVALLARRGQVHVSAVGSKAVGGGEPIQRDPLFRITSMTKPVTAVAALTLVEECRLRLDDPVDGLLPELSDRRVLKSLDSALDDTVPARRPITLRDLIFKPLGMVDTAFKVPAEKLDRLSTSYLTDPDTCALSVYDQPDDSRWSRRPLFPSGAGDPDIWCLVSTVDDYLAFARMLMTGGAGGDGRILSRPTVETMTTDQLTPDQRSAAEYVPGFFDSRGWGLGVVVVNRRTDTTASSGAYGWDGGFGTSWLSDPREDLVTILMTQAAWTSPEPPDICRDFRTSAYRAIDD